MLVSVSAATAVFIVVVAAFAFVLVASAAAVIATTAASLAAEHVQRALNFVVGGGALRHHPTAEVQVFAGERVVEVDDHCTLFHLKHQALKAVAVGVDEWQHGAGVDGVLVEAVVDAEEFLVEFHHVFLHIGTVGFVNGQGEVESLALGQGRNFGLETVEGHAEAGDELEGVLLGSLLHQFVNAFFVVGEEFVCHGDIPVGHIFHCECRMFLFVKMRFLCPSVESVLVCWGG